MDLVRHLRYFVAVAEELHFGNAAIRLGMAQPPLSQRIKRLEEELGVRLFDRSARQVRLTEPGRLLLGEAREIVARVDRMRELVKAGEGAVLKVGAPPDLAAGVVAAMVAGFRELRPGVRLAPAEMWTVDQVNALASGALDVGLVRHPVTAPGLRFGPELSRPLGVLLAEGDALARQAEVHPADLAGRDLLMPPEEGEPGFWAETLAECRRRGYVPAEIHQGSGLGLVLAGAAVTFWPAPEEPGPTGHDRAAGPAGSGRPDGLVWRPLLGGALTWRLSTAWRSPSPAVLDFAAVAVRTLKERGGMAERGPAPIRRVSRRPGTLA
ncbi:LysR family transcriptional regulator [Nonomuraea sp. NPDC050310]|uniref:LysR family transcriptional regulator n=1 Tax=Nonomuraea sp. NPDC050310 TaxID=3154935 RepID=UPI0033DF7925